MIKVIGHEIGHYMKLDLYHYPTAEDRLGKILNSSQFAECIVEAFASIINILNFSIEHDLSPKDEQMTFENEVLFNLYQTAKLLVYSGKKDFADFLANPELNTLKKSIIDYHIYKTMLLLNLEEFLNVMKVPVTANDIDARIRRTTELISLLELTMSDNSYISEIDRLMELMRNDDGKLAMDDGILSKTMRMSLLEKPIIQ